MSFDDGEEASGQVAPYSPPGSDRAEPARVHPGPHIAPPAATEPDWWERLRGTMDLDAVLAFARDCRRARDPESDPVWHDVYPRLRIAEAMLLDALDAHPGSRTAAEYLRQVQRAMGRKTT